MKKIYLFITLLSFGLQAQEINWISFTEALEAQKTEPKKIFMYVYANWCGPCKLLDKHTFSNKDLIEYVNINFYLLNLMERELKKSIFMIVFLIIQIMIQKEKEKIAYMS